MEYMEDKIGNVYEGIVSGVTGWGLYVELPNTVEGMVRLSEMDDDYYIFDEAGYQLIGEHTRRTYKLGQKVKVEIVATDKALKTIEMLLV